MTTSRKRELSETSSDPQVDFLDADQHALQDEKALKSFHIFKSQLDDVNHEHHIAALYSLVQMVAFHANASGKQWMKSDSDEITALLEGSEMLNTVRQAWQQKRFRAIRMIPLLQIESIRKKVKLEDPSLYTLGKSATTRSWTEIYVGKAWKILENKIRDVTKGNEEDNYARFFTLVQSSGMGKSRLVDEYSKHHVVIPLCLRKDEETGFPHPDSEVRDFLCEDHSHSDSLRAVHAFLFALFQTAERYFSNIDTIVSIENTTLPEKFWLLMSDPHQRNTFYSEVLTEARRIKHTMGIEEEEWLDDQSQVKTESVSPTFGGLQGGTKTPPDSMSSSTQEPKLLTPSKRVALPSGKNIVDMAKKLAETVQSLVSQWGEFEAPILLSFDESHTLTAPLRDTPIWSPLFSIRSALRSLRNEPIFSVFLSTTGKFSGFVPAAQNDPSRRLQQVKLRHHEPICGLGYDLMTTNFVIEDEHLLDDYASVEGMSRFGRPLFYTRWKYGDSEIRKRLISFAAEKILGGTELLESGELTPSQIIAVLSIRIPLEFNATTLDGRLEGFNQVHKHMRLSIAVNLDNQTCATVQPAEPLLAEAALHIIKTKRINQANELLRVLGGPSISKGDRGEFTCVLLWLLARDKTVQKEGKCVIKVLDLMDDLLAMPWHDTVRDAHPSELRKEEDNVPFREAFKDAVMYFTQFIKVHDAQVINRSFLWTALARGAAILCANNQAGLDIIIPILIRNEHLSRKLVSAIIIQVKNRASYGASPDSVLFDLMNPYRIGLYDLREEDTHPVIRMVFALGSDTSKVLVMPAAQCKQPDRLVKQAAEEESGRPPKCTSYDIWCAKTSTETFSVIEKDETFAELLKREKSFPRSYESSISGEENARRQMHPMALSHPAHWHFASIAVPGNEEDIDKPDV